MSDMQGGTVTATSGAPTGPTRRADDDRRLGRIDIHSDPDQADAAWAHLESLAPGSIYQTRRFLRPWLETFGRELGIKPMLIVAHDAHESPVALLPFGIRRHGPVQVAQFLGGTDSNANLGLFRPDFHFGATDIRSLLHAAAARSKPRPDVFLLVNQPEAWEGDANPLDIFPHQMSASYLHSTGLTADARAFMAARLAGDKGKKLRKKEKRLAALGPVSRVRASTPAEVRHILDAFFAQKLERFRRRGIDSSFTSASSRQFLEAMALDGLDAGRASLELHALVCDDRIVAVYGGGEHRGHFNAMVNSFDLDEEISKTSPGDLLLKSLLEEKCAQGLHAFDLGIGEARYKTTWCPQADPLFDSILAVSTLGDAFVAVEKVRRHAKRWIKQSDWAWPLAQRLIGRS
jgi:CelD/BcsL family acetyltransferase involved in cellulose biosynthesis